jgi:omega-amidase
MPDQLKIALFQFDVAWMDIHKNLQKVEDMCAKLENDVDIIFLPEMFATGFTIAPQDLEMEGQKMVVNKLIGLSAKYKTAITGSHPYFEEGNFFNRLLFVAPDSLIDYYNKRHLFSVGEENYNYHRGTERKFFEYKGWKLMPQICYDLRFPVWSRNNLDYDLLFYSANWPSVRNYAWETLLKARAIENQSYVVGINRIGKDGRDLSYIGNSQIISANGEILMNAGNEEKILTITLEKDILQRFRKSFPILMDSDSFTIENN